LPGAVHDLTAARIWGIVADMAASGMVMLADKGYLGAGEHIRTLYGGRNKPASQKDADRAHARLRRPYERANAPAQVPRNRRMEKFSIQSRITVTSALRMSTVARNRPM